MDLTNQEESLLKECRQVAELAETQGWKQVFQPWLQAKRDQSFPDPSQFKDIKQFNYAAIVASVYKKVVAELLIFVDDRKLTMKQLLDKKEDRTPVNKFKIGV
jgi:hypothetical protein